MKRSTLLLLIFALVSVVGGSFVASANHCGATTGPNGDAGRNHDPFGSCEGNPAGNTATNGGAVHCDASPDATVPMVGVVSTPTSSSHKGVQACADDSSALPIAGRVGVFVDANNNVTVFADGDDVTNSGGASAWDRVDVRPNDADCKVRVRRGSHGQWSQNANGGTSSPADPATDVCVP